MNEQDLKELREIFRLKFGEHDFCIGEKEVEKVFRELLNETELVKEYINTGPTLKSQQISSILEEYFSSEKFQKILEQDHPFYKKLK